jgi:hypothetical protein
VEHFGEFARGVFVVELLVVEVDPVDLGATQVPPAPTEKSSRWTPLGACFSDDIRAGHSGSPTYLPSATIVGSLKIRSPHALMWTDQATTVLIPDARS